MRGSNALKMAVIPVLLLILLASAVGHIYRENRRIEAAQSEERALLNRQYMEKDAERREAAAIHEEEIRVRETADYIKSAGLTDPWEGEGVGKVLFSERDFFTGSAINADYTRFSVSESGTPHSALRITSIPREDQVVPDGELPPDEEEAPPPSLYYAVSGGASPDNILILRFFARTVGRSGRLSVALKSSDGTIESAATFPVTAQWTEILMPVAVKLSVHEIDFFLADEAMTLEIYGVEMRDLGKGARIRDIKSGMFLRDDYGSYYLKESEVGVGATEDLISDEDYLYSIRYDRLSVSSLEDPETPRTVAVLTGLGNARHIAFCDNGSGLVVTSRGQGAFFIDISDREKPVIVSNYSTLELATGIYVQGNYAFICSRYSGVEIVDIGNMEEPVLISVARGEGQREYQDCFVSGRYLYIGVGAQDMVDIWDVSDVSDPVFVNSIDLGGHGYGVFVEDGILFAATGMHARGARRDITDIAYGSGYGMEIYDVSNPEEPVWMSAVKADGRGLDPYDRWKVQVSKGIAYLAGTFSGLYIYDVSDPYAPVRIAKAVVPVFPNSSQFRGRISDESYFFPWDYTRYMQDPITSVTLRDGRIYTSGCMIDAHVFDFEKASPLKR